MWYTDTRTAHQPVRNERGLAISKPTKSDSIPHDTEAEESVIAGVILNPAKVADVAGDLYAEEFYVPLHQKLWSAWCEVYDATGDAPDQITWARHAGVETEDIIPLVLSSIGFNRSHVDIIKKHKVARDIMALGTDVKARAAAMEDPYELAEEIDHFVADIGSSNHHEPEAMTIWEMSELSTSKAPWIIPGALKQDWRAIVTGPEGTGKGVLMRCLALATASGVHPFTHRDMEAHRTLLVDLENPVEAVLETGLVLADTLLKRELKNGVIGDDTSFRIWHKPGGINIRDRQDRADLIREIVNQKPKLVCIGPWYKLNRSKPGENWEDTALSVLAILDDLRVKYGFALVIEAHSAKASGGNKRPMAPSGSVYLQAWPEIGISLQPDEDFKEVLHVLRFREDRLKSNWPVRIERDPKMIIRGVMDAGSPGLDF